VTDPVYLAIDTSTDTAGLAIARDGQLLAELTWHCRQNHSMELMPRLNQLMQQAGVNYKDVSGIVVARGPGSFNGLRVGISSAKGLAYGLGVPVVGVVTLEATAYQHRAAGLPVCAAVNAGRGEIGAAVYQQIDDEWGQLIAEHVTTVDALCRHIDNKTVFCGPLPAGVEEELRRKLGDKALIASPSARLLRAGCLLELGAVRLDRGEDDGAAALQPLYLRRPQITQPKNKAIRQNNIAKG